MKNVNYYSAGAGSGKTYKLTHLLADKIQGVIRNDNDEIIGKCSPIAPSQVILTTFTRAAAADFRERSRAVLFKNGLYEQAALLDQALIGTIHSVGEAFIHRYWYLLGLSPEMNVMDDDSKEIYINESLSLLATKEDIIFFRKFSNDFNITKMTEYNTTVIDETFWKDILKSIIEKALQYRVQDFENSCKQSLAQIRSILDTEDSSFQFEDERKKFVALLHEAYNTDKDNTSDAALKRAKTSKVYLDKKYWTLADYPAVARFLTSMPQKFQKGHPEINDCVSIISKMWRSKVVYDAMEKIITRIFAMAEEWKDTYLKYKQEMRIIDYNDMETYMVELLKNKAIAEEIKGRYKCVMVDEFQDCSPIQIDIFNRLSDIIEESYWCGDSKQAIYGFRGTDTDLTETVSNMIPRDHFHTLDTSYRSEPAIVTFCNKLFANVFNNKLDEKQIVLLPHRKKKSFGENLIHWKIDVKNLDDFSIRIADYLDNFFDKYAHEEGDEFNYNDIAILARKNSEVCKIANSLTSKGIPVKADAGSLTIQKETELLIAILTLITEPSNQLAKAKIAYLTTPGYDLSALIDSRLTNLQDEENNSSWLMDNPLVARVLATRKEWSEQSVSAIIESVYVELNLRAVFKSWNGSWSQRETNVYQIINIANEYEEKCQIMTLGVTITGFLGYLQSSDAKSAGNSEGVVVTTYHNSKGMQWKNVIMVSLNTDFASDKNIFSSILGVQKVYTEKPSEEQLFPEVYIRVLPLYKDGLPSQIQDRIKNSDGYNEVKSALLEESKRLLYVGMTRAQDKLITTEYNSSCKFRWLNNIGLNTTSDGQKGCDLCGTGITSLIVANATSCEEPTTPTVVPVAYDLPKHDEQLCFSPKYIAPSHTGRTEVGNATLVKTRETRIPFNGQTEMMDIVGNCIHNTYAICTGDREKDTAKAIKLITDFELQSSLPDAQAIIDARIFLTDYLTATYGHCTAEYHELPFCYQEGQQLVRGSMDLVWETANGCVLVDFKTYPGKISDVVEATHAHYAGKYKPQFDCYSTALDAAGKKVLKKLVFYPITSTIVEIK